MHRTKFSPGLLFEKVLYKPDTASFIIRTAVEPIDRGLLIPCVEEASYPIFVFGEIVIANLSISFMVYNLYQRKLRLLHITIHSLQVIDTFLYKRRANKFLCKCYSE